MNSSLQARGKTQKTNVFFLIITLMLTTFCIMKVLRGADTESTVEGGIWNYISLLYYPVFLIAFTVKAKQLAHPVFISSIFYIVFAVISASVNFTMQLNVSTIYQFLMIPYSMLVFLTFYLCSGESKIGEKILLIGYFGCLAVNIYSNFSYRFVGQAQAMESDVYFSLGMFPFALQFLQNKKIRAIVIVLEFFVVFMVNKRTALISFVIALVLYLLIDARLKGRRKFSTALKAVIVVGIVLALFFSISKYIDDMFGFNIYSRLFNLVEDGGSGRDILYSRIWLGIKQSSFAELLVGHGMNTAGKIVGVGQAHNDFLEILYDYGIMAFIPAVSFYWLLIVQGVRLVKRKSPYAATFAGSLVVGFFLAMFSYFIIYYTYVTCIVAFWGYVFAMERKRMLQDKRRLK